MKKQKRNSFNTYSRLSLGNRNVGFYSLPALENEGFGGISRLPVSIRILLETALRNEDGGSITEEDISFIAAYDPDSKELSRIPFKPFRVLLQDFTGVPCLVDLAAMRSAMDRMGGDTARINPLVPVDLVIDHSVQVDSYANDEAFQRNSEMEFQRNRERYEFLRWGKDAFRNFSVVPPARGICHQVNLEYLGKVVQLTEVDGEEIAACDSLVGTDSHTPMINGLGVLGWGVGGIEAEAAMLGEPVFVPTPPVVGVKMIGELQPPANATDLVLYVTQKLREKGVVGSFVEYFGKGLGRLTVPDRATLSNMSPEYGATVGFFPVDDNTLDYLRITGRSEEQIDLVERFTKEQGIFRTEDTQDPDFRDIVEIDLGEVVPSLSGPKRPQDRIPLREMKKSWNLGLTVDPADSGEGLKHGDVVIAAITSCTNTSNPYLMIAAALLARNATAKGLTVKPWVKTSFAPGSIAVTEYIRKAGLTSALESCGFHLVAYGCTTCIGNSGPLRPEIIDQIREKELVVAGVLSGNRNFEGRINRYVKANFLASPPLVVAYALAGTVDIDMESDPIGNDTGGAEVYLKDIWPGEDEILSFMEKANDPEIYLKKYQGISSSNETWNKIPLKGGEIYSWPPESTYIQEPPFFRDMDMKAGRIEAIESARVLVLAGDSITTDHISPAGEIPEDGPAGRYLLGLGVEQKSFNSFGSRRGNDRVMTRGTFANVRMKNKLAGGREGGWTALSRGEEPIPIFEAARRYAEENRPLIVIGGKDYGMGSSRDWAAKGVQLLGVKAVLAESYERIHRSNLVGMGVLPLQFLEGEGPEKLDLQGFEEYTIKIDDSLKPGSHIQVDVKDSGTKRAFTVLCRIDSPEELEYYRNGGILNAVLRRFLSA